MPEASKIQAAGSATGSGVLYTAALGTTLPGGLAGSLTSFTDAGHISDDGVDISDERNTTQYRNINGVVVKTIQGEYTHRVELTLMETTMHTQGLVYGSDNVASDSAGYNVTIDGTVLPHLAMVLDFVNDGDTQERHEYEDAQIVSVQPVKRALNEPKMYALTIECFPATNGVIGKTYYEDADAASS